MTTAISLISVSNGFLPQPGEVIDYFLGVTNVGTHVIDSVQISSTLPLTYTTILEDGSTGEGPNAGDSNGNGRFDVGETWYYTAYYTVTEADLSNPNDVLLNSTTVTASGGAAPTPSPAPSRCPSWRSGRRSRSARAARPIRPTPAISSPSRSRCATAATSPSSASISIPPPSAPLRR
jgi:uncharacterized repeat protein (TIGR01451 family)